MAADTDVLKIPVELDVSDKELTSLAKSLTQVTKGVSKSLEASMQSVAFRLQQSGWRNKGDITDKILSYVPQGQKINEIARRSLSAAVGRGKGLSLEHTRTQRILAAQQVRERIQAERRAIATQRLSELQANALFTKASYLVDVQDKTDFLERQFDELQKHRSAPSAPKWIKNLLKDVKGIHKFTKGGTERTKQIESYLESMQSPKKGFSGLPLGKFFTAAGIATLLSKVGKFLWNSGKRGLSEGYDILSEQAKYGPNRAIGLTKMMSTLFGIDEGTAASIDRYARDFRQRLMWGEVGEREFIGLGRMGEAGRMLTSGRAEKDPRTFLRTLQKWMLGTDSASVRSVLRQMNWSEDLMKLKLNPYDDETFNSLVEQFDELTDREAKSAADALAFRNDIKVISKQIDANVAEIAASVTKDPVAALRILRGLGRSDEDIERMYPGLIKDAAKSEARRERIKNVAAGKEKPKTLEEYAVSALSNERGWNLIKRAKDALSSPISDMLAPKKPSTKFVGDRDWGYGRTPLPKSSETKNISNVNNITVPVTINGNAAPETAKIIGDTVGNIAAVNIVQFLNKTGEAA